MSTLPATAAKDPTVEAVRGLACLMVVAFHVFGAGPAAGLRVPDGAVLREAVDALDYVHMPIFALIGGLAYAFRPPGRETLERFFGRKARRIGLPLLAATTLFALSQSLVPGANGTPPSPFWHVYVLSYAHFWYLQALILLLLIFVPLDALLPRRGAVLAGLIALSCLGYVLRREVPAVFSAPGALYLMPFFLLGVAVTRHGGAIGRGWGGVALGLGAAALGGLVARDLGLLRLSPPAADAVRLAAGAGLAVGLLRCGLFGRAGTRWLCTIGGMSYTIYLYHVFGTAGARVALREAGVGAFWVLVAAGTLAGVLLPMGLHRALVELGRRSWVPLPLLIAGIDPPRRAGRSPLPVAGPEARPPDRQAPAGAPTSLPLSPRR